LDGDLIMAKFFLESQLEQKVNDCLKTIGNSRVEGWDTPFGWCYVEPNDKSVFSQIEFTNEHPAIHVNMNHLGNYGTGKDGKNHHFTSHCEVCYEDNSNGKTIREDWGDYRKYFTFDK